MNESINRTCLSYNYFKHTIMPDLSNDGFGFGFHSDRENERFTRHYFYNIPFH